MLYYYAPSGHSPQTAQHVESVHEASDTESRVLEASQGAEQATKTALTEILNSSYYRQKAKQFHESRVVPLNPSGVFESVCCSQKEFAVLPALDDIGIGSSKATTCVILLAHNPTTGHKAAAHVDSTDCKAETIASLISETAQGLSDDATVKIGLVGAYDDAYIADTLTETRSITKEEIDECEEQSLEIVLHTLDALRNCDIRCVLALSAVLSLNTKYDEKGHAVPRSLDAAMDTKGNFFKPDFLDGGPAPAIRNLRFLSKWTDLQRIAKFDHERNTVVYEVKKFPLESLPERFLVLYKS